MASRSAAVSPARAAAFAVLLRVFEDDAYADRALRRAASDLDERDRGLAQRLAYGAVQRVRTLDHAIELLGRRRVARLDAPVRAALRLGAYQLAFVDGVARYAAVNESVELVRRAGLERAVAFTNAVLRRLAEGIAPFLDSLPERHRRRGRAEALVSGLDRRDAGGASRDQMRRATLMLALNEPAPTVVRLVRGELDGTPDPDDPGRSGASTGSTRRRSRRAGSGRRARRRSSLGLTVGAEEGERTLDLCAAPGGKATMLPARSPRSRSTKGARASSRRTAVDSARPNVRVVVADGRELPAELRDFDRRARGRTVLRSGCAEPAPDLRWRAMPLPELQLELLRSAAARVRPGGTIVYSVCTITAEECEDVDRCVRPHGRFDPAGGVAGVPPSAPTRVPADPSARPRDGRVLHRASARLGGVADEARSLDALTPTSRSRPIPRRVREPRPSPGAVRGRGRSRSSASSQRRTSATESTLRSRPTPSSSRSPTSGFGSMTSHGSRCARRTLSPWRSWLTSQAADGSTVPNTSSASSSRDRSNGGRRAHSEPAPRRASARLPLRET